jgi:uncharacterized protein YndB with AHSA1/START domain
MYREEVQTEVTFTRFFAAPRELVWKAWTDPKMLAEWWGPKGFTNPKCNADVRVGGAIDIDMRAPNGTVYPMTGNFEELGPPERLVFTASALDEEKKPLFVNLNTVLFSEVPGGTQIDLHVCVLTRTDDAAQYLKGMRMGWISSLEKLDELLEKQQA